MTPRPSPLHALVEAFLAAFTQGKPPAGRERSGKTAQRSSSSAAAAWREPSRTHSREEASPLPREQESPGQNGNGATRDLTLGELKRIRPSYAPDLDGEPDPGEVIWTWVPYVENDGRGKDRPVLIIARLDSESWAACYLSTKQHRDFVAVGTGSWDSQGRVSYLSPERVLRVTEQGMRRESTGVDRAHYDRAVQAIWAWHRLA